jgi:hypothetical protein
VVGRDDMGPRGMGYGYLMSFSNLVDRWMTEYLSDLALFGSSRYG